MINEENKAHQALKAFGVDLIAKGAYIDSHTGSERNQAVIKRIVELLGIDLTAVGSVKVTQAQSEVFTAVYIREIA